MSVSRLSKTAQQKGFAMTMSGIGDVTANVQKYWAPVFMKELLPSFSLAGLVNKEYQGEIKKGGDSVTVSQINAPTGQTLTIGTNADTFNSQALSTSHIHITADKRFVAAFEFDDMIQLQSQLDLEGSDCRNALEYALRKQINDYLVTFIAPSTATPDHLINSCTDFTYTQLAACRTLAAQAHWNKLKPWYGLLDPSYFSDILDEAVTSSADYGAADAPAISGELKLKRAGFQLVEDDSKNTDTALLFHPDWLHLVLQPQVQVKISDLHSQKKFGYLLSVDLIGGAALGIDGAKKHICVLAAASGHD